MTFLILRSGSMQSIEKWTARFCNVRCCLKELCSRNLVIQCLKMYELNEEPSEYRLALVESSFIYILVIGIRVW